MGDPKSSQSKFIQVATNTVAGVSSVRLYHETWDDHILKGHPELIWTGREGVLAAASEPTIVYQSATSPQDSFLFVNEEDAKDGEPLHVPAKLIEGTSSARIASAYYRTSSSSWTVLWRRTNRDD